MSQANGGIANLTPLVRAEEQKAWYWYDWANSAYTTTIGTVFFGPYFINLAENAVGGEEGRFDVGSFSLPPDSLFFWLITVSTILSAVILPPLGAYADRVANKKRLLATLAWIGSSFAALIFFATGDNWQLAAVGIVFGNLFFGAAGVVNDSILPLISDENERDRVSSRGWAFGYLGGGLLLVLNLAVYLGHDALGLSEGLAARLCMLSAAAWWAGFTFIPFLRLNDHPPVDVEEVEGNALRRSFGQLAATLRDMRNYPMALTFLVAYLFFNDGIQTVIASASVFGSEELGHSQTILIATILMVQFVAFGGALLFGRLAGRWGAKHTILVGLGIWCAIVTIALFLPAGERALLPDPRRRDRPRPRRHPGAGAVVLLPPDPPRQGGRVLQLLPRHGPRHVLVRDRHVRHRPGDHRLLPTGDLRPHRLLRDRWPAADARRHRARHPRGRQRRAGRHLTGARAPLGVKSPTLRRGSHH